MRKMRKQEWIVIAIAAAIVAGVWFITHVPLVSHHDPIPPTSAAMHVLATVIDLYQIDNDTFPATLDVLKPTGKAFDKPYLKLTDRLTDAWGVEIRYTNMTNSYMLTSAGPDRKFGTKDDIVQRRK